MLKKKLGNNESLMGRSVEMTISATGYVEDAYDTYIDIYAYNDQERPSGETVIDMKLQLFVRLIFWETTHKRILIGTVSVLDDAGLPPYIIENIERISIPVEKKDFWKKMFEKHVVVDIAQFMSRHDPVGALDTLNRLYDSAHPEHLTNGTSEIKLNKVCVNTCPIASYEWVKRSENCPGREEEQDAKCYEGTHGFVRSDNADGLELHPTSMPITMVVK